MREIKFRYWTSDKMLNQEAIINSLNKYIARNDENLMQYTGLKDKNGVEIYEGDIVSFNSIGNEIRYIKFENGGFYCISDNNKYHRRWEVNPSTDLEVIGNIYENKELVNVG